MIDLFFGEGHIPTFDPDYFTESERISKEETTEPDMGDRELRESILKKRNVPTEKNIPIRKKFEAEKNGKIKSPFLRLLKKVENGEAKITDELPYTEEELWKILETENEYLNNF